MSDFQPMHGLILSRGQYKLAGVDRRAACFQQRPGGKPSVATVTEPRRKSLCIVTKATTVDRWGRKDRQGRRKGKGGKRRVGERRRDRKEGRVAVKG